MNRLTLLCSSFAKISVRSTMSSGTGKVTGDHTSKLPVFNLCRGISSVTRSSSSLPLSVQCPGANISWKTAACLSERTHPLLQHSHDMASLAQMHRRGPPKRKEKKKGPTEGRPTLKGVVLKTLIKKPKKPNSANRKCVRVRLSTGREATAYVPGEGHNLQEHHIVLLRGGRSQDLAGVKLKCVRGKYDLAHVKK